MYVGDHTCEECGATGCHLRFLTSSSTRLRCSREALDGAEVAHNGLVLVDVRHFRPFSNMEAATVYYVLVTRTSRPRTDPFQTELCSFRLGG